MAAKAGIYLNAGTRLVWVVWPHEANIDIWRIGHPNAPSATLGVKDVLDGEDVIPGFAHAVARIFADPSASSPA